MTKEQLSICQHALGLDCYGNGTGYRNHFVAGGDDVVKCRELVTLGYMREYRPSDLSGGCPVFAVIEAGRDAVKAESPKPKKLTRSQRRYREFLDNDGMMKFGEWLKATHKEQSNERAK